MARALNLINFAKLNQSASELSPRVPIDREELWQVGNTGTKRLHSYVNVVITFQLNVFIFPAFIIVIRSKGA
jgi:hypothetical protein